MKISVVIACYNGAKTVGVVLDSLCRQQWPGDWEVVFVNNGSTDASESLALSYQGRLPALRVVQGRGPGEPHSGVGHTYAVGMRHSTGDAILLLDADDEPGDAWLAGMAEALAEHDFVAARMDFTKLNAAWLVPRQPPQDTELIALPDPPGYPFVYGCTLGIRRAVIEKVGYPDASCGACVDMDYCFRAYQAGFRLKLATRAVLHYRLRDGWQARYVQGKGYGHDQILAWAKYLAQPSGRPYWLMKLARWLLPWLVMRVIKLPKQLSSRQARAAWVWDLGWGVGRLRGMLGQLLSARQVGVR